METDPESALDEFLDEFLDALAAGDRAAAERILETRPELRPLAGAAHLVAGASAVSPGAATRARHVQAIMEEASRLAGPQVVAKPAGSRRLRRVLAAVGACAGLLVVGAPATAALAANAQPGQTLYGTKLFIERVELAAQRDPARRIALRLKFARERVDEISRLVAAGKSSKLPSVVADLASEQAQVDAALSKLEAGGKASPELVQQLQTLAQEHQAALAGLAARCDQAAVEPGACDSLRKAREKSIAEAEVLRNIARSTPGAVPGSPAPSPAGGTGHTPGGDRGSGGTGGSTSQPGGNGQGPGGVVPPGLGKSPGTGGLVPPAPTTGPPASPSPQVSPSPSEQTPSPGPHKRGHSPTPAS